MNVFRTLKALVPRRAATSLLGALDASRRQLAQTRRPFLGNATQLSVRGHPVLLAVMSELEIQRAPGVMALKEWHPVLRFGSGSAGDWYS
jgi:hypothetical protein